jgi:hypothetical protein
MMVFLTFLSALLLSGIAEFYSVIGLASIFPGAYWPVIVMGGTLGFAKIVTTSWVYRNWATAPRALKYYLTGAVVILMLITSMGIFGYLSKAHLEHSADMAPLVAKVQLLDDKIKVVKEGLDANRKVLKQLDDQVDQTMGRTTDEKGIQNSVNIRRSQQKERLRIAAENETYQKQLSVLNEERYPFQNEVAKAESDFGPIKYVAELIYGSGDRDVIDKAVRLVIMLIMIVFDPLAVLLLIAGNMTLAKSHEVEEVTPPYTYDNFDPPTEEEKKQVEGEIDDLVKIAKENISTMEEVPVVVTSKKLEPTYDYNDSFSFREKDKT